MLNAGLAAMQPKDFATAKSFHDAMEHYLKSYGADVVREYEVLDRGDGRRGRIDLVVTWPLRFAVELDDRNPRQKSLYKLRAFNGEGFVVLRHYKRIVRA